MSGLASSSIPWVHRTKLCRSRCPQKAFSSRRELDMSGSLFVIQDPTELCESMVVCSMITCDTPLGCSVFFMLVFILFETVRMTRLITFRPLKVQAWTLYDIVTYSLKQLSGNTNKMQLCNRIYYSKVYWRLNTFRAAHRSSSGALNCICSL